MTPRQEPSNEAGVGRRTGDPRLTAADRAILERIATGDLADDFAAALAASSDADPLVGGAPTER